MTTDEQELLEVGGEQLSLSQIGNIAMDGVAEVRFATWPIGIFEFRTKSARLDIGTRKGKRVPVMFFPMECRAVLTLADETVNAEDWIGKEFVHQQQIAGTNPLEDVGRGKAFMADAGFKGSGTLQELLTTFEGTVFRAPVKQSPDKNDKDVIYSNIVQHKMEPVVVEEVAAAPAPTVAPAVAPAPATVMAAPAPAPASTTTA